MTRATSHPGAGRRPNWRRPLATERPGSSAAAAHGWPSATVPTARQPSGTPRAVSTASSWSKRPKKQAPRPRSTAPSSRCSTAMPASTHQYGTGQASAAAPSPVRRLVRLRIALDPACRAARARRSARAPRRVPASESRRGDRAAARRPSSGPCPRPSSATKAQPWLWPADGARRARSTSSSITPSASGSGVNARTIRRRRTTSLRSTRGRRSYASLARSSAMAQPKATSESPRFGVERP